MRNKIIQCVTLLFLSNTLALNVKKRNEKLLYEDVEGKSSLVFVFDTTGSMYNDLRQLREGAELILDTALQESDVIADFVFVPFHDPAVGPATVTRNKHVFKSALNIVQVYGGGDCPEKSLGGIQLALNVSRPRSFVYVFTDATASDHRLVGKVLDAVQRKQSQVVFVLTGHCNDLHKPSYKVYQQIAAASSGQVFNLNKTSVHKVLDFVRSSIKGRTVNLGSIVNPAGYNYTQEIPVDNTLGEVTVSVSGAKPQIKVVNPSGEELTGPPKLIKTLDLSEIMVVKVLQPEPGNWTITVGSNEDYSVKVVGLSNLTFNHGFSVQKPASMLETSYRPLQGTYNHMMISLTQTDIPVRIDYAEVLDLSGKTLFEVPLHEVDSKKKIYLADAFVPPEEFFYISINGRDEHNQELRRIGATAVQAKPADAPYLTAPQKKEARSHERVVLKCYVESLVPVTAMWTKDTMNIQPQISSLQSTSISYVIDNMSEENVGTYRCVAKNVAGLSKVFTELTLLVDPPQVSISPENTTVRVGVNITISCTAISEALLLNYTLIFNSTEKQHVTTIHMEPNIDGVYIYNKSILQANETDSGTYTCIAVNRGGQTNQTTHITVQTKPSAQILGPHTLTKYINTDIQFVCHVENASQTHWVIPNDSVINKKKIEGSYNSVLDVKNVTEDGIWTCVALRGSYKVSDSVNVTVLIKPQVSIDGPKNVTVLYGANYEITCRVKAKPAPRIVWHRETERYLNNNNITLLEPNVYKSVLTLNTRDEALSGTYFCFGENSEGIHQDSVTVNVRRKMKLVDGFTDKSVELYSQVDLHCHVDSYPAPRVHWHHNGTTLQPDENVHLSDDNTTVYILKVDFDNLGSYCCEAKNEYETVTVNGTLSVYGLEPPKLSKQPAKVTTQRGKSTKITCRLLKGKPEPTITWQYKRKSSDNFTDLPYSVVLNEDRLELVIPDVDKDLAGIYRCTAENVLGTDVYDVNFIVQYPPQFAHPKNIKASLASAQHSKKDLNKKPLEVKAGEKVVLSCKADGVPPPVVLWTKDDSPMAYSKNIHLTDSNELVIEKATQYDSGLFTCNVTSSMGSVQKTFTLIVYIPPTISPPKIESQLEVLEGQLVEMPCIAQGVPEPRIQWLQNGELVQEGRKYIDEGGLRFVANLTDFGEYVCIAKNNYGNATFNYTLYIWVAPSIEAPLEVSKEVLAGAEVRFQCDVVGFPLPSVLWVFQDNVLQDNTTDLSFNEYGNVYIKNASSKHEGFYVCIAENVAGVAKKYIYLSVNEPPRILDDNYTVPYIATDMDTALMVSCKATGKPKPYVMWSKDDFYLDKDYRYDVDIDGTLIIKNPTEDLSGLYTCIAKNTVGETNRTIPIEIYTLPKQVQAEESQTIVTVVEGANTSIECPIKTSNNDKVKWYKDAKLISHDHLRITNVSRNDEDTYACVVTNAVASTYSKLGLNVEWPPAYVTEQPLEVQVVRGNDWYFDCTVDAKPIARTRWLFNSKPLLGEDKDRLKLLNVQLQHIGTYKCVVNNKHGTITRQYTLDVLVPPFISEFDVLDVELKEGVNATLECNARGSPKPNITWTYNNTKWHVENSTLISNNLSYLSEGVYRCDAANRAGGAHIVYRVNVATAPNVDEVVMYNNGKGVSVVGMVRLVLGSRVRLSCIASGKPKPKIQWIRNGHTLSENARDINYADLIIENIQTMQSGTYSCIATNEGGSNERVVKIDVSEPPRILQTQKQNANETGNTEKMEVISGQAFYLHCHPYGNPLPELYWFKDGLPLMLFDDTMIKVSDDFGEVLVSNRALENQSGNYTCVARNEVGETSVVYLVDVLVPPPKPKETSKQVTIRLGKALNLTCPVEGTPLPYARWVKQPYTEITDETPRVQLLNDNYTLIINNTETSDSGNYSCIITNKVGTTEVVFDVTVEKAPSIAGNVGKSIVESHTVPLKRSIILKCDADGHPPPKISWLKDTLQLSDSVSNIQRVLGDSLLAVWSVRTRDAGQYICVVENGAGTAHRRYNVVVKVPGKWSTWTKWSLCNVTCGLGYQQRSRLCQYVEDDFTIDNMTKSDKILLDESACKGPGNERRKCHMPPCEEEETQPRWSVWSKWSQCSSSCGAGTQARTRRCKGRVRCYGDNVQIRKCPNLPKCDSKRESPDNEVYSREEATETNNYIPEATFEMQPEVINSHYSPDVEEFYVAQVTKPTPVYYEVNVTENLDHSDRGPCDPGYRHNDTIQSCDDIDECLIENNHCHSTQVCVNTVGGYRCTCPHGYFSLGVGQRCLDVNECVQETHGCEYACVNVAGGYVCACPRHLRLHRDKHHCVDAAASYKKPISYEVLESDEEYLSTFMDFPAKYTKYMRN